MVKDVAKKIQDDLHDIAQDLGYNVVFNITDNIQRYESDMRNKDEQQYNPCVLQLTADPFTFESLDIKVYTYQLRLYALTHQRHQIEHIFKEYSKVVNTTLDMQSIFKHSTELFIDDFVNSEDGRNQKRFHARVTIELQIPPHVISGNETTIKIGGVEIPFNTIRFRKDKSLIPNVPYADNNFDIKLVDELFELEIPIIETNTKIGEILLDVLNDNYNKSYQIEFTINNVVKTVDTVLRVGNLNYNRNNQPITFWVTFQRALTRKDFKIDGVTIPALRWGLSGKTEITSQTTQNGVKSKPLSTGRQVTAMLLNNGSNKVNEIISTILNHDKDKRFNLQVEINSTIYSYSMIIESGSLSATEHPDLVVEVLFLEGW